MFERACRCFPLNQVITFNNKGSSESDGTPFNLKRMHCLDVCLSVSEIESIVESRPGGKALLQSNARFLHLVGRGSCYEIRSDDGTPLYIVRYNEMEKKELRRVIEYAQLDVKGISREEGRLAFFCCGQAKWNTPDESVLSLKELVKLFDERTRSFH